MKVIDADAHVEESVAMFSRLEEEFYPRRPLALGLDSDTAYGSLNAVWLIDGVAYPKVVGRGATIFLTPTLMDGAIRKPVSVGAQEMTDIETRLKDLDAAGIDQQVVYPTLFLATTSEDVKLEAALVRAYNTFMADACARSGGRLRFAAIVPIRDIDESIRELRRARRLGAISVMLLGMAWDKSVGDRCLWPFYEEAASLDTPVSLHVGWGCPAITEVFDMAEAPFCSEVLPVVMGARSVLASGVLDAIPNLRFALLEAGSLWVLWVIQQIRRGRASAKDAAAYFREGRVYVSCEADEDINYVANQLGEDCLLVASDYPHSDFTREEMLQDAIMARDDLPARLKEKLLSSNPQKLYGL
jgi:aminocarboxymuconate-semialdehyde decarboxylase